MAESLVWSQAVQVSGRHRSAPVSGGHDAGVAEVLLYSTQPPSSEVGWGGTSFVAPQLNGSAAVIDSYLHHRTGFWNPAIYRFAAVRSWTPFTPLDAASANNDNLYYTGSQGAIYNPGSGLGVPNLDKLALDFRRHGRAG